MQFFSELGTIAQNIATAVVNAVSTIADLFVVKDATTNAITGPSFVGYLALGAVAFTLVGLGLRTILKLVKMK